MYALRSLVNNYVITYTDMLVKTLKSETVYEVAFDLVGVCLRQLLCIQFVCCKVKFCL